MVVIGEHIREAIEIFEGYHSPYEKVNATAYNYIAVYGKPPEGVITEISISEKDNTATISTYNPNPKRELIFKQYLEGKGLEVILDVIEDIPDKPA